MKPTELEALLRRHQVEIHRYLRFLGAAQASAEDLVQETFLAAFRSPTTAAWESWEPGRKAAWLRGIARNQFRMHCRRVRTERARLQMIALEQELEEREAFWANCFLRDGDGADYVTALRQCLQSLPEAKRQVLDLCYREGRSRAELASAFNLSADGVKSLLRRIRQALGECVERRLGLNSAAEAAGGASP